MAREQLNLRTARIGDVEALAQLEAACWPANLPATSVQLAARISAFAAGQWLVENDENLVAYSSAQQITDATLQSRGHSYRFLTDNDSLTGTHTDNAEVHHLIGISVHPHWRGQQLGRRLLDRQIARAWEHPSTTRVLGFTRPVGHRAFPEISLDEYVARQGVDLPADPVLAFHQQAGARIISVHEGFRPEDLEALGAGVLIEYPTEINQVHPETA